VWNRFVTSRGQYALLASVEGTLICFTENAYTLFLDTVYKFSYLLAYTYHFVVKKSKSRDFTKIKRKMRPYNCMQ